jgi:hypothetical protein
MAALGEFRLEQRTMSRTGCLAASALILAACSERRAPAAAADSLRAESAKFRAELSEVADSVRRSFTASLRTEVDSLERQREMNLRGLQNAEDAKRRLLQDLPGIVSLDSLNAYYSARWNESGFSESFETTAGEIRFAKSHFTFAYVPSTRETAFNRIGKERDSYTSREVIRAWLREATDNKQRQGFTKVYLRSGPAEYGEYTEALYRNGDAYFKTFFRYGRVLETYGRHSLQYDYYAEVGSSARADRYRTERYNSRLGSQ